MPKERLSAAKAIPEQEIADVLASKKPQNEKGSNSLMEKRATQASLIEAYTTEIKEAQRAGVGKERLKGIRNAKNEAIKELGKIDAKLRSLGMDPDAVFARLPVETAAASASTPGENEEEKELDSGILEKPNAPATPPDEEAPDSGMRKKAEAEAEYAASFAEAYDDEPASESEEESSEEPASRQGMAVPPEPVVPRGKESPVLPEHEVYRRTEIQDMITGLKFRIRQIENLNADRATTKQEWMMMLLQTKELPKHRAELERLQTLLSDLPDAYMGTPTPASKRPGYEPTWQQVPNPETSPKKRVPKHEDVIDAEFVPVPDTPKPSTKPTPDAKSGEAVSSSKKQPRHPYKKEEVPDAEFTENTSDAPPKSGTRVKETVKLSEQSLEDQLKYWEGLYKHLSETASDETEIQAAYEKVKKLGLLLERERIYEQRVTNEDRLEEIELQQKAVRQAHAEHDRIQQDFKRQLRELAEKPGDHKEEARGVQVALKNAENEQKDMAAFIHKLSKERIVVEGAIAELEKQAAGLSVELEAFNHVILNETEANMARVEQSLGLDAAVAAAATGLAVWSDPKVVETVGEEVKPAPYVPPPIIPDDFLPEEKGRDWWKTGKKIGKGTGTVAWFLTKAVAMPAMKAWEWTMSGIYQGGMALYDLFMGKDLKTVWQNMKKRRAEDDHKEK
jgi:hypothetical protein